MAHNLNLQRALAYAERGIHVLPLHTAIDEGCTCSRGAECPNPGKHPRTKNGKDDATTDMAVLCAWWKKNPNANVGIATSPASGVVVLDIDAGKDGFNTLATLEAKHGKLPITPAVRTGGGGEHRLFKHPGVALKLSANMLGAGVDFRADGGHIVAPPSMHASGNRYEFLPGLGLDDVDLADAPAWLIDMHRKDVRDKALAIAPVVLADPTTELGQYVRKAVDAELAELKTTTAGRNHALNTAAYKIGTLVPWNIITEHQAEQMLLEAAMVNGYVDKDGQHEALKTLRSGLRDGMANPRSQSGIGEPLPKAPTHIGAGAVALAMVTPMGIAGDLTTELGQGLEFARRRGDSVKHVQQWGWMGFTGTHWEEDAAAVARAVQQQVVDMEALATSIAEDAARLANVYEIAASRDDITPEAKDAQKRAKELQTEYKALLKARKELSRAARINGIMAMAAVRLEVVATPADFDADPWLFNVKNGTIDLRTGELAPHDRKNLITKIAPIAFDPRATCPRWERFLLEVMDGDQEMVDYLQRAIGYSLTGNTREQCFFVLHGFGRNGKSVFTNVLMEILGTYAKETQAETLMMRRQENGISNDVADLAGARFISANETEDGQRLAEAKVKGLTGGDRVKARFLHREFFEFMPSFKLWLRTNHKPTIRGTDDGIWRRIKLIPFTVSFEGKDDKTLADKLTAELPGILAWAVRGCLAWQNLGNLGEPESVKIATQEYRIDSDVVGRFTATLSPTEYVAGELYQSFKDWCEENGEKDVSNRVFGCRLNESGWGSRRQAGTGKTLRIHPELMGPVNLVNSCEPSSRVFPISNFRSSHEGKNLNNPSQGSQGSQGSDPTDREVVSL
jgi:putative DNA primase/helicase